MREGIIKKERGIVVLGLLGFLLLGKSSIKKRFRFFLVVCCRWGVGVCECGEFGFSCFLKGIWI